MGLGPQMRCGSHYSSIAMLAREELFFQLYIKKHATDTMFLIRFCTMILILKGLLIFKS
mgnify:CR=1 FL=1